MNDETTYNGWTNYETWNVNLWMTNDETTYNEALRAAVDAYEESEDDGTFSRRECAARSLADRLKSAFEDGSPLADDANAYADLLDAAISEVNWQEIADSLLDAAIEEAGEEPDDV